ncbi:hypothetical protein Mpsy_2792 [Methanolobus psychrophilus R15]|nr:hypothetical protein Mpsy_2792 [Methanolobus psychrophilus R15]
MNLQDKKKKRNKLSHELIRKFPPAITIIYSLELLYVNNKSK